MTTAATAETRARETVCYSLVSKVVKVLFFVKIHLRKTLQLDYT